MLHIKCWLVDFQQAVSLDFTDCMTCSVASKLVSADLQIFVSHNLADMFDSANGLMSVLQLLFF